SIRILNRDFINYGFEKCDTVVVYNNNRFTLAHEPIAIFTDLKRAEDIPYEPQKGRDFAYLKEYIELTERNMPTYQHQDSNQLYILKKLPRKDVEEPQVYVLGKVKDNKYIGYVTLPDDF